MKRLSWMPWLYFSLKPKHRVWAEPWQAEVQRMLMEEETVEIAEGCFVSPDAGIFAELGRPVRLGPRCTVAALAFLHGPLTLSEGVRSTRAPAWTAARRASPSALAPASPPAQACMRSITASSRIGGSSSSQ
jgi:hypothetical protein